MNRKKRTLTRLLPIAFLLFGFMQSNSYVQLAARNPQPVTPISKMIDNYILSYPDYDKFSGVVFASVGDEIIFAKGYGKASIEHNVPNTIDTKFAIGSLTKVFTATLILKMNEMGLIELDGTISDYLDYYPIETGSKITIRHLLTHSSGIPHHITAYPDFWAVRDNYYQTPKDLVGLFSEIPLVHEPGEGFTYSSPAYYVLGAILEQITKESYAELVKKYILDPLGMKETLVDNSRRVIPQLASGYQRGLEGVLRSDYEDQSTAFAAGDMVSCAKDLFLWRKFLTYESDNVLTAKSKRMLLELPDDKSRFSAAGIPVLRLKPDNAGTYYHLVLLTGSSSGYTAAMHRFIENDETTIVLSNIGDADTRMIVDHVGDFVSRHHLNLPIGNAAPFSITPFESVYVPAKSIIKNLGFYKRARGSITGIVKEGDHIYQLSYSKGGRPQKVMELTPEKENLYILGYYGIFKCKFNYNAEDGIPYLELIINGKSAEKAPKIMYEVESLAGYAGYYSSANIQKTYRIKEKDAFLILENFLGPNNYKLTPLEKDLFGFEKGFIEFLRDENEDITEFKLVTRDVDTYFDSKFIRK